MDRGAKRKTLEDQILELFKPLSRLRVLLCIKSWENFFRDYERDPKQTLPKHFEGVTMKFIRERTKLSPNTVHEAIRFLEGVGLIEPIPEKEMVGDKRYKRYKISKKYKDYTVELERFMIATRGFFHRQKFG